MYLNHADLSRYFVCDIEADGLSPTVVFCLVIKNAATKETWRMYGDFYGEFRRFCDERRDAIWVFHNGLSYDLPVLQRLVGASIPFDRCVDTLCLSYLYHPQMPDGHSLEAWGERFKLAKVAHNDWTKFSPAMLERCERDVDITLRLFLAISHRMRARGFSERSCELEHRIRVVVDEQQRHGFYFNIPAAEQLYKKLRDLEGALSGPIRELFPPVLVSMGTYDFRRKQDGTPYASYERHLEKYPKLELHTGGTKYDVYDYQEFNIGSPVQRIAKLQSLGWVPTKFTKKGNPQVDEDALVDFAKECGRPEVAAIAEWLVLNGRANMVNTWLGAVNREDSRMHGKVQTCGAASRRMTHSNPNTANIPSNEAKYGTECRALWGVADTERRRLVGYDAKSIQMRLFASLLPDPRAGQRYWDTELCPDPHQENADLIGIGRKPVKSVFYANLFGAYPKKLGLTAGFSGSLAEVKARGEWIKGELFRVTPGLKEATEKAQSEFRANGGFLRCLDGGYVRCPSEHAALNYKIQPAEAVIMKTASIMLADRIKAAGWDVMKVGDIHDEGQLDSAVECAREVGVAATECIRDAGEEYGLRVPLAGDFKVGTDWSVTH